MKIVIAFAFLALAKAAFIERPIVGDALWHKTMEDMWKSHMMSEHSKFYPSYMMDFDATNFDAFKKFPVMSEEFSKPSLVFFEGPDGKMVSFFAHEGIDNIKYVPEVKSAFTDLYGAADKVAVHFRPEDILGGKSMAVLPGHFFQPENSFDVARYMQDMPVTHDFSSFKFPGVAASAFKNIDVETLPFFHKDPVTLDMTRFLGDTSVVPATHGFTGMPVFSGASVVPFTKSAFVPTMEAGVPSHFRSGLTPAYHLVKADYPFFTAAPATGLTDSSVASPALFKTASPFFTSADSGFAFAPHHASGIIPASAGAFPLVKAVPVGNYKFAFSPVAGAHFRSAIPATFGAHPSMNYAPLFRTVPLTTSVFPATAAFSPAHSFIPLKF